MQGGDQVVGATRKGCGWWEEEQPSPAQPQEPQQLGEVSTVHAACDVLPATAAAATVWLSPSNMHCLPRRDALRERSHLLRCLSSCAWVPSLVDVGGSFTRH